MDRILSFTTTYNGLSNVLNNEVHVADPITTRLAGKPLTEPPKTKYNAIWDTGATCTAITERVANECGLVPVGVANVHNAGGVKQTNVYIIDLLLPNRVVINGLRVTEAVVNGADLLVGMDVIGRGDFAVSNFQGKTVFTYRFPSTREISFVNMPQNKQAHSDKVGRNDPCTCGSGKKYKKCCGALA